MSREMLMQYRNIPKKLFRRAAGAPAFLAYSITNFPSVDRQLSAGYETAKRRHAKDLPPLSDDEASIVADLGAQGWSRTTLDALAIPGTDEMMKAATTLGQLYE